MRRHALYIGLLAILILPQYVGAAGFAKESLFLSKNMVTEGDTVFIHAVVSNEGTTTFTGTMVFTSKTGSIGSAPVSLEKGEAAAVSVSWKPSGGTQQVTAELKKGAEVVEKQSANFSIKEKTKGPTIGSSDSSAAVVESSAGIQEGIASFSPVAAATTKPFFTLVDGGRVRAANIIESQAASAQERLQSSTVDTGELLGASTVKNAGENPMGTALAILNTLYIYVLTLLGFLVSNAGIFYPFVALIVLYLLWRLIRRSRRPTR
jgi:hypothetical protein